ncbi:hypothetical protein [Methanospirillum lacunae]
MEFSSGLNYLFVLAEVFNFLRIGTIGSSDDQEQCDVDYQT